MSEPRAGSREHEAEDEPGEGVGSRPTGNEASRKGLKQERVTVNFTPQVPTTASDKAK